MTPDGLHPPAPPRPGGCPGPKAAPRLAGIRASLAAVLLLAVVALRFWTAAAQAPPGQGEAAALAGQADLFRQIVEFVVERDPVLQAQEAAVAAARRLEGSQPAEGADIPSFAQSQLRQAEYERAGLLAEAQQQYTEMERQLVAEVMDRARRVLALLNQIENQERLLQILQERESGVERQVQAGILEPSVLWELSDRIMAVRTTIANTRDELQTVKSETAFSYGGEDWRELLALVDQLAATRNP